jgi:hypothetical protein
MDYDARFCFPAAPLLFALAGYGMAVWYEVIVKKLGSTRGAGLRSLAILSLVAIAGMLALWSPQARTFFDRRSYGSALEATHVTLGRILAGLPGEDTLASEAGSAAAEHPMVALGDAGAIPYYSGWRTFDTFGLNNRSIALSGRRDPEAVLAANPDLIILTSLEPRQYAAHETFPWESELYEAVIASGRVRVGVMSFSPRSYLWLMADPDSAVAHHVSGELRALMRKRSEAAHR